MATRFRAIARALWRAFAALLLLLLVLVLSVAAYLGTKHGRARLLGAVVADLQRAIPGGISVRALERLSLTEVVISGFGLRARAGNDVLTIGRVRARLAPWSLLRARFVVSELALEDGLVDLRFGDDPRRGLSSALVDTRAPRTPAEAHRAIALAIETTKLDRWRVRLPSGRGFPERDLEIAASLLHVEVGSELRIDLEPTQARLLEQAGAVGSFLVRGCFRSMDVSRVAIDGDLFGMPLAVELTLGEPARPISRWRSLPFVLELSASQLVPGRLRRLTAPPLPLPALEGSFAAQLTLRGVPDAFEGSGSLRSAAGAATFQVSSRDLSLLQLSSSSDRIALRRLLASLPDWQVASQIDLSVRREREGPARLRFESTASMRVGGHALPQLTLRAERSDADAWRLDLGLHDRWLSVASQSAWASDGTGHTRARGWLWSKQALELVRALGLPERWGVPAAGRGVDAEGRLESSLDLSWGRSGALDARAILRARALELGNSRIERLAVELELAGTPEHPRVRLDGRWRAAARGSNEWTPGRLELHGGPRRHHLQLRSGTLSFGSVEAWGWLEREDGARRLELTATGRYGAAPWRMAIHEARWQDGGRLSLPRVELELNEQRFLLHGHADGARSQLVLELGDADIGRVLQAFWAESELAGKLSGRVEARGELGRPELQLGLRASRLGLGRGAMLDARLDGALDIRRGHFQIRASARESTTASAPSPPRLDVALDASGRIDAQAPWPMALAAGDQRARFDIQRLDSAVLSELTGAALPASFDVQGSALVHVRRGVPSLVSDVEGSLEWAAAGTAAAAETDRSRHAKMTHSLRYEAGRAETDLSLVDGHGPWLRLHASVDRFREAPPSLVELARWSARDWRAQLAGAAWRVELDTQPRSLDDLPAPAWVRRMGGAAFGARLVAHRARDAATAGELTIDISGARRAGEAPGRSSSCSASPLTTQAKLRLHAGRFELDIEALDRGERKLHLTSRGELDVAAWLRGQAPNRPRVDVIARAAALPLERLPFVCDQLRGELTAEGRARDLLGSAEASGDVELARFSLGSEQTVDLSARVSLDAMRFELAGQVLATGRASSFQLRLPRRSSRAAAPAPGEVSIELSELPLAPLVPLDGPISHASGRLSGSLRASAGAGAPRLSGALRLDDVGLTVTDLAQPLSDIDGQLSLSDGVLSVKRLSARDGDGRIELSGTLKVASARSFDGSFALVAHEFPLRQSGEVVAHTTATARVEAAWRPERHRLRVELENFDTWLERREAARGMSLAPHPDLRVRPADAVEPEPRAPHPSFLRAQRASPAATLPLTVQIDAAQQFWVKRADFALELSADLDIEVEPAARREERPALSVTGQLRFNRGYMEMMGKTFEVKRGGVLRFTGGTSAMLDLTASYRDRRSSQQVVVHVQGSATAPKLDFSVDGEKVSAGEAFQAIYGSSKTSEDDVDPEAQASQIISALMAGVLTTSVRRKLGSMAPILSVDPADEDRGDQVRAGFELDALIPGFLREIVTGIYIEGSLSSEKQKEGGSDADVQKGVLIELYFPYDLVSSGRYGPDAAWSLDIGWQPRGR